MPDWQVFSARITTFVAPDVVAPPTVWRDMIDKEPDTSVLQRATSTRTETGLVADGTLTLQVQPMRIDWVYEPVGEGRGRLPQMLGPFPAAAEPLLELGRRWPTIGWFPSVTRLALGLILISPTPDRENGYLELAEFIDGVPNTPDATDFQYQVNRPRASRSGVDDLQINRLSKWSVGAYRVITVSPGLTNVNPIATPLQYHLRLELDISTNADFQGLIPRERVADVLDDLRIGSLEVVEHGNNL